MSSNFFFPYRNRNALLPAGAFFSGVLGTPGGVRSQRRSVYEEHHNAGAFYNFEPRYTSKLAASYDRRKIGDEGEEEASERNGAYFYGIKDDDEDGGSAAATIVQKKMAPEKVRVQKFAPVAKVKLDEKVVKKLALQFEEITQKQDSDPITLKLLQAVTDTSLPIQVRRDAQNELFGKNGIFEKNEKVLAKLIEAELKAYPGADFNDTKSDVWMTVDDKVLIRDDDLSTLKRNARNLDLKDENEKQQRLKEAEDTRTNIDPLAEDVGNRFLAATQGQDVKLPDLNAIYEKYVDAQKTRNDMKGVREDWIESKGSSISPNALKKKFKVMRLRRITSAKLAYNKANDADRNFLDALRIDNFDISDWVALSQFYKDGYTFKADVRQKLTSLARELPTVAKIDDLRTILLGEQGQLASAVEMETALTLETVEKLLSTERAFMPPSSLPPQEERDDMDVDSDDLEAAFDGVTTRSQMRQ